MQFVGMCVQYSLERVYAIFIKQFAGEEVKATGLQLKNK